MDLKQIMNIDPAGMIPGMIKNMLAKRMANGLQNMVDYLKDGIVPQPVL